MRGNPVKDCDVPTPVRMADDGACRIWTGGKEVEPIAFVHAWPGLGSKAPAARALIVVPLNIGPRSMWRRAIRGTIEATERSGMDVRELVIAAEAWTVKIPKEMSRRKRKALERRLDEEGCRNHPDRESMLTYMYERLLLTETRQRQYFRQLNMDDRTYGPLLVSDEGVGFEGRLARLLTSNPGMN